MILSCDGDGVPFEMKLYYIDIVEFDVYKSLNSMVSHER